MNPVACPHCNQLNPESQQTCERCGQSLRWTTVGRSCGPCKAGPKAFGYALLGVAIGMAAVNSHRPHLSTIAPVPVAVANAPRIDVVFALDTTGSMGDELDVVKTKVSKMMEEVRSGTPRPEVRFGLVAYRDHGDAYVTKGFPLTSEVSNIESALYALSAGGGGDTPEAVGEGLRVAVDQMNWDQDSNTTRMVFLIGDAGGRGDDDYAAVMQRARQRGIKVNTWGCSGLQNFGESDFEQIAALGNGEFQYLTYQQMVTRSDGSKSRLVYQGAKAYEVEVDADWAEGADKMAGKREVTSVEAPGASGSAVFNSRDYAPDSGSAVENNMDTVLVRQVQSEASKRGVSY